MTLEQLNRQIETTSDLRNIVSTMKMLSSVSVNQYMTAQQGISDYLSVLYDGFKALNVNGYLNTRIGKTSNIPKTLAVLIGSDNGLVGSFNKNILLTAKKTFKTYQTEEITYICIGRKLCAMAQFSGLNPTESFPISNTIEEIADIASQLLLKIEQIKNKRKIERVVLFYNQKEETSAVVQSSQLIPFPTSLFDTTKKQWRERAFPYISMDFHQLFLSLIHEYLTTLISQAIISSLACEHYTRMINMQQAEKNIDDSLEELNLIFAQNRQTAITDELIDIISGANSLKKKK